jgi:hypothetical protein
MKQKNKHEALLINIYPTHTPPKKRPEHEALAISLALINVARLKATSKIQAALQLPWSFCPTPL